MSSRDDAGDQDHQDRQVHDDRDDVDDLIRRALSDGGIEFQRSGPGAYLVTLPGTHKLGTMCWLVVGEHSMLVEAFVMRQPDENHEELYRFLLRRNARMYGVAFCVDPDGDVYLAGRVPLHAVTPDEIDRLLGAVLTYADENFNAMLELGFASSIRREWRWRAKRGESVANLRAFARFAEPPSGDSGHI